MRDPKDCPHPAESLGLREYNPIGLVPGRAAEIQCQDCRAIIPDEAPGYPDRLMAVLANREKLKRAA